MGTFSVLSTLSGNPVLNADSDIFSLNSKNELSFAIKDRKDIFPAAYDSCSASAGAGANGALGMLGLNEYANYSVPLLKGNYNFIVTANYADDAPIVTFKLDTTVLGSIDFYDAGGKVAQGIFLNISVSALKLYTLNVKNTGKNAASSGYNLALYTISFVPL